MKCPECGREMEPGFIQSNGSRMFWREEESVFSGARGEPLTPIAFLTFSTLKGSRCPICKLVLVRYDKQ